MSYRTIDNQNQQKMTGLSRERLFCGGIGLSIGKVLMSTSRN